jgi:hypothetical protein
MLSLILLPPIKAVCWDRSVLILVAWIFAMHLCTMLQLEIGLNMLRVEGFGTFGIREWH